MRCPHGPQLCAERIPTIAASEKKTDMATSTTSDTTIEVKPQTYRRILLPLEVEADQITASYTQRVLEVRIPLPAQAGARKISVT